MATDLQYNWSLTEAINRIPKKMTFLNDVLFGGAELTLPTSRLAMDVFTGNTGMAPLVRRGHPAKRIDGRTKTMETIINIPEIKPSIVKDIAYEMDQHQVGIPITTPEGASAVNPVPFVDAEAVEDLNNKIIERKEWMLSRMMTGTLSYAAADLDFTVNYNIPGAHDITAGGTDKWDDAACDMIATMQEKYLPLIARATGNLNDTWIIIPPENLTYLLGSTAFKDKVKWTQSDIQLTLAKGIDESGFMTIHNSLLGCRWGCYFGQFNADTTRTATNFIDALYIFVVKRGPQWRKYNCPIATNKGPVQQPIMVETYEQPLTAFKNYQAVAHFMPVMANPYSIVRVKVR